MKRVLKWVGGSIALLVVVGIGLVIAANVLFDRKRERIVKVDAKPIPVVADAALLERGKYLFMSRGCGDCHAASGAGRAFIDEPGGFYVRSPNITSAGVVAKYTELDWVRAIRHGVNPLGRPLFIMPSEDYNRFTDRDVAAIVAYARSLPAVSGGGAEFRVPLPVKTLYVLGVVKDSAQKIDHSLLPASPVPEGVTPEHGKYVANRASAVTATIFRVGRFQAGHQTGLRHRTSLPARERCSRSMTARITSKQCSVAANGRRQCGHVDAVRHAA